MSTASEPSTNHSLCPVCESPSIQLWRPRGLSRTLAPADLQITDAHYGLTLELWKCPDCSFVFATGEEMATLSSLYQELSDPDYEKGFATRAAQMRWLLNWGLKIRPKVRSVLEIGAGIGLLTAQARAAGLHAVGIEPSRSLVAAARRMQAVDLIQGAFPHPALEGCRFDLVYAVDVIEHVADPLAFLKACVCMLNPGGCLVVVTPDIGSVTARLMGRRWWHFRLAHVGYFNRHSMQCAAGRAGLTICKEIRAVWFFPIHYLLERVAVYLPLSRHLERYAAKGVLSKTIRLNLHDSNVFFMEKNA
ncbi:MAG: hypothetical protein C5B51_27600 [Terriglobia bacterium]|nr:MAG: hypothetical protein C5B51_27600 [Terriglobia bacterium]